MSDTNQKKESIPLGIKMTSYIKKISNFLRPRTLISNIVRKLNAHGIKAAEKAARDADRVNRRVDELKSMTFSATKAASNDVSRVNRRVDTLKGATLPIISEMKKKLSQIKPAKPPFYDNLRMFTYFIDKEFTIDQKKWFLERQSYRALGYFPNIDNPRTFNEKTQWYKLYYRDPLITTCIDKYLFKDYVANALGPQYVVPLLGVWDRSADINFDILPNEFALKSNWGSGSRHVMLVHDKMQMDIDEVKYRTSNWTQPWENVYYHTFDWGYKDIAPKIFAEKLINGKSLEYKFFCFNGEPKFLYVATDSSPGVKNTHNYYDMEWNLLPFVRHSRNAEFEIQKPNNFDEMLEIARRLSAPFPHVRVDLCQTDTGLLVEELTFYVGSGTGRFTPREWDLKFGEPFVLPELRARCAQSTSYPAALK